MSEGRVDAAAIAVRQRAASHSGVAVTGGIARKRSAPHRYVVGARGVVPQGLASEGGVVALGVAPQCAVSKGGVVARGGVGVEGSPSEGGVGPARGVGR